MEMNQTMEPWGHYLVGISILLLGVCGTPINGYILYKSFKKYKNNQGSVNSLLVNLALANLGIILFAFPLPTGASFKLNWFWGDFWCTYYGSIALLFGFVIMIMMVMLVLDVFLQFNYTSYELHKNKARKVMIFWAWINGVFWSVAPLIGWSRISYEPTNTSCTVDLMHPDKGYISYIAATFIICYLLPIGFMIYCRIKPNKDYVAISKEVNHNYKQIALIIMLFVIEWSPYASVYVWAIFDNPKNIPISLAAAAPVFAKLSVVLTPLVFIQDNEPGVDDPKKT